MTNSKSFLLQYNVSNKKVIEQLILKKWSVLYHPSNFHLSRTIPVHALGGYITQSLLLFSTIAAFLDANKSVNTRVWT